MPGWVLSLATASAGDRVIYSSCVIYHPLVSHRAFENSQSSLPLFLAPAVYNRIFTVSPKRRIRDQVDLSVIPSGCGQDYCKTNQRNSLKLGVMIGPTNRKNRLYFGGDPVPDTNAGSLFHFLCHCGIRDFMRFISISHIQSPAGFHDTRRND